MGALLSHTLHHAFLELFMYAILIVGFVQVSMVMTEV